MVFNNTVTFLIPSDHFLDAANEPTTITVKAAITSNNKQVFAETSLVTVTTSLLDNSTTADLDPRDYAVNQVMIIRCSAFMLSFSTIKGDANGYSMAVISGQSGGNSSVIGTPVTLTFSIDNKNDNSSTKEGTLSMAKVIDSQSSTQYLQYKCLFDTESSLFYKVYKMKQAKYNRVNLQSNFNNKPATTVGGSDITLYIYSGVPFGSSTTTNPFTLSLTNITKNLTTKISTDFAGTFTQVRNQSAGGKWRYIFNPIYRKFN